MSDEEQEQTVADDLVVTKYKMGGDIANRKFNSAARRGDWRGGDPLCLSACREADAS